MTMTPNPGENQFVTVGELTVLLARLPADTLIKLDTGAGEVPAVFKVERVDGAVHMVESCIANLDFFFSHWGDRGTLQLTVDCPPWVCKSAYPMGAPPRPWCGEIEPDNEPDPAVETEGGLR